jgi:hypothetical protein
MIQESGIRMTVIMDILSELEKESTPMIRGYPGAVFQPKWWRVHNDQKH